MSKVSIIVPVYNTSSKLHKCLDSLVNQTIKDIEIIIVNDGSTDNCEQVVNEFKIKYNNIIKYYYKINEGVAKARNFGIKKANSDYIFFVDSDDYIDTRLIERVMPYINENVDLIKFKLQRVDEYEKILEKVDGHCFEKITGQEAFNKLYCKDVLIDSPCVYIIKKELFTENNFKFNGTYHEDFGLIPLVIVSAKSVVSIPDCLYSYIQSTNSLMRNDDYDKTLKKMDDVLFHYDNAIETMKKMNLEKRTKENLKIYYTNAIVLKLRDLQTKDKKIYIKEIKKRKMYKNIKPRNIKQFIKRELLKFNINLYLKMR